MGDVIMLKPRRTDPSLAYKIYREASKLDEDAATMDTAVVLYNRAISLDPMLSIAYTNLANIHFRRGDRETAEKLYQEALLIDPMQPEARYNLGFLLLERGLAAESVPMFERAIKSDPRFADAHFNVAMAFEQLGKTEKAQPHWRTYVQLEPTGTWSDIARRHIIEDYAPIKSNDQRQGEETRHDDHQPDSGRRTAQLDLEGCTPGGVRGSAEVQGGHDRRRGEDTRGAVQDVGANEAPDLVEGEEMKAATVPASSLQTDMRARSRPGMDKSVPSKKNVNFSTMIRAEQYAALRELSEKSRVSIAQHIRQAIDNYLQTEKEHAEE